VIGSEDAALGGLVVRPRPWSSAGLVGRLGSILGLLALSVGFSLKQHGWGLVAEIVAELLVGALMAGLLLLGKRRLKFTLDGRRLRFTGRFREREIFSEHQPGKVVELKVVWAGASKTPLSLWTLINADGACEVAVDASGFDPHDLGSYVICWRFRAMSSISRSRPRRSEASTQG
jgi:hypothetical protein